MINVPDLVPLSRAALTPDWVAFDGASSAHPFSAAAEWLQGTLLGPIATSVALIAVASIGLLMLNGRVPLRRGVAVISGCFILFGAPAIAAGLVALAAGTPATSYSAYQAVGTPPPVLPQSDSKPPAYDPYAGAAVPQR
jgi:type IV secretory pathway VirB2 component (pilin)